MTRLHCLAHTFVMSVFLLLSVATWANENRIESPSAVTLSLPDLESIDGVFAIAQDSQGFMWFGGKNGLRRYDGYKVDVFRHDSQNDTSLSSNDVSDILVDREGRLWVALLSGGGLNRFDPETEGFIRYERKISDPQSIGSMDVYALEEDKQGNLWLATHDNGLNKLVHSSGHFQRFPISLPGVDDGGVRDIAIDNLGNIWAATNSQGVYKISGYDNTFHHYEHHPNNPSSISDNKLFKVFCDSNNILWFGTQSGGVDRFDPRQGRFIHYTTGLNQYKGVDAGMVWDMAEDANGKLWVSTGGGTLSQFNKARDRFDYLLDQYKKEDRLSKKIIKMFNDRVGNFWLGNRFSKVHLINKQSRLFRSINLHKNDHDGAMDYIARDLTEDSKGRVWIATNSGLGMIDAYGNLQQKTFDQKNIIQSLAIDKKDRIWFASVDGIQVYDSTSPKNSFVHEDLTNQIDGKYVKDIVIDSQQGVWFATQSQGVIHLNTKTKRINRYVSDVNDSQSLSHNFVWTIFEDSEQKIWVGTLRGLNLFDRITSEFKVFMPSRKTDNTLCDQSIRSITEDRDNNIWLGTSACLSMLNKKEKIFTNYDTKNGMADDSITTVIVDDRSNVWSATQRGISRLDSKTKKFKNFNARHGIAGSAHPRWASSILRRTGEVLISGIYGITSIDMAEYKDNVAIPPVVVTDLFVNGKKQKANDSSVLKKSIGFINAITLTYAQRNFSFEFSALNYVFPEQNRFRYKLVGYDDGWHEVKSDQRRANYTNIDYGNYTFLVKGSNNDGVWNEAPVQIKLKIMPPWWLSTVAWVIYSIIVFALLFLMLAYKKRLSSTKIIVANKRLELDKLKQQFIANASRELIPSLNTITGLSENILDGGAGEVSRKARQHISMIHENGQALSALAQDMSSFAEPDMTELQLNIRPLHLEPILEGVSSWFQRYAERKSLKLYLSIEGDLQQVNADYVCIQKVLFNLIDNAIRHTEHGYVELIAKQQDKLVMIQVADTGKGIEKSKLGQMFSDTMVHNESVDDIVSNITLAYSKRLIERHHGDLTLESTSDEGTTFAFTLPVL